jgi:thiamine-phosphate pyrophosphorylase
VAAPQLLAISDRLTLAGASLIGWAAALDRAGVASLQLREKELPDAALHALALALRPAYSATLLVNGRADVAVLAGADGVHLPADGVPTAAVRRRFGAALLVGRSTHTVDEVERAAGEGADYVTFGPVFASPGKGEPVGLAALERAAAIGIPVLALGGVGVAELPLVARAGAAGAAAIRLFQDLDTLPAVVAAAHTAFGTGAAS